MDESFSFQFYALGVKQYFIMHKLLLVWGCVHPTPKGFEISMRRLLDYDGQGMHAYCIRLLCLKAWGADYGHVQIFANISKYWHVQIFPNFVVETNWSSQLDQRSLDWSQSDKDARIISMFFQFGLRLSDCRVYEGSLEDGGNPW